jgi:2-hydroxycyclohexanecarboxyl-CoA dehydrogenase
MNLLDLSGKSAFVTGAGQGVGRQIALHLAAHGARVGVNDVNAQRAQSVVDEIIAQGGAGLALSGDVTDFKAVMAAAEAFGGADILVNNAGNFGADPSKLTGRPFWEQDPEEWRAWVDVNFYGVLNCSRAFLPGMVAKGAGSVINVISDAGRVGEAKLDVYSGAKAGAAGFTRAIARSVGRFNVRANCVAISTTRTPTTAILTESPDVAKKVLAQYVIRRFGEPSDVANMVLFLASDATTWVTGQTYPVNGGFAFSN